MNRQAAPSLSRAQERQYCFALQAVMSDRIRQFGQITCLYDMDIVDPHQFSEVYLYEELMEADLHAIVRPHIAPQL